MTEYRDRARRRRLALLWFGGGVVFFGGLLGGIYLLGGRPPGPPAAIATNGPSASATLRPTIPPNLAATFPVASVPASAVAAGQCSGPVVLIVDQFHGDVVQGGNATPPIFNTGGKKYCLTHLATYHWNGGAGDATPGTFTLLDATGKAIGGPWTVVTTPGTGGTPSGWEADAAPTPFVINGTYTLKDSVPATLSWSKASAGQGFVRVWGTAYVGP